MKQFNFLLTLAVLCCCGFARAQAISEITTYMTSGPGICDGGAYVWNSASFSTWDWLDPSSNVIQHEGDSIGGLCAGTYTISFTDSTGSHSETFTISDGNPCSSFSVYMYGNANNDSTNCNGSAWAYPSGGTEPYNYTWNDGSTNQFIESACAGTYMVSVTDANGCSVYGTYEVVDSAGYYPCASLWASVSTTNTSGPALCDGTASAQVYGGTAPYAYYWSNGVTSSTISNLCMGYYTVNVTDANGCVTSASGALGDSTTSNPCENFGVSVSSYPSMDSMNCTGSAYASAYGGTAPYNYTWSNGATGEYIGDLCPGYYTVSVTTADGCSATYTFVVGDSSVTDPCANVGTGVSINNVSAAGECDGNIFVYGIGGTALASYSWSNGATTAQINNLCEGYYTLLAYDQNGCEINDTYVIGTNWDSTSVYPLSGDVYTNDAVDNVTCTGTAYAYGWGGTPPYSYLHSNGSTSEYATDLCPGTYNVIITDANGQSVNLNYLIADSASIWVNNPYPDSVVVNDCSTGIIEVCDINFSEVTNVYIESYGSTHPDSITVVWAVETTSGTIHIVGDYYIGNSPDGVYSFELSIFCPEKSIDKYLKAFDQLYLERGSLSIAEGELADVKAYPNPFADALTIQLPEAGSYEFNLLDLSGRVLRTETVQVNSSYELNGLSELATGRYLLQVVNNGTSTIVNIVKH